jgi:hypothetical protein
LGEAALAQEFDYLLVKKGDANCREMVRH